MSKKFIIIGVVILALAMLFVACDKPDEDATTTTTESTTEEITTDVDDNGAYVFNKDGDKVYLKDDKGFIRSPEEAYNSSPSNKEDGFSVGNGEGDPNASVNWEELE